MSIPKIYIDLREWKKDKYWAFLQTDFDYLISNMDMYPESFTNSSLDFYNKLLE